MSSAKFTLIGCEKYFHNINQSLFDNLILPTGLTKTTLTDNILLRGGEFEVQYGDPDFLRSAIGSWSNKWMPTMQRWVDALAIEYNPLENYDRMEDWTDNTARSDASTQDRTHGRKEDISHADSEKINELRSETGSENRSDAGSESREDHTTENGNYSQSDARTIGEDVENITDRDAFNGHPLKHTVERSAYDSSSYEPLTQETDTGKLKETVETDRTESAASSSDSSNTGDSFSDVSRSSAGSVDTSNSGTTDSTKEGSFAETKDENENESVNSSSAMNNDFIHSGRIHGNIGVTTSQQMLQQELDLGYWNIYEKITELFLQEFTIPVYL